MNSENKFTSVFNTLQLNQYVIGNTSYKQRKAKLTLLQRALEGKYKTKFQKSLQQDLNKPVVETNLLEIYPAISDIKIAKRNLRKWMDREPVKTPIAFLGTSSYIKYEPKGVCLIISPWNFPLLLTLAPLVSAIAAGNVVVIKPSEIAPHTSAVLAELVSELFDENEVKLIEGGVETSTTLLQLPFNHIHFTGSPTIGKIVMEAASKHLASVTLELGGKSPTIIDKSASILSAAEKIAWGCFMNCGQTCVAPDYILVEESIKKEFIEALIHVIKKFYRNNPESSRSYGRIVSKRHFNRLKNYLDDAENKGATLVLGGETNADENYIAPTILEDVALDTLVMQEEIFGPILPIISYQTTEEVIEFLSKREKPLAMYIFSKRRKFQKQIIQNTRAGSTCINNNIIQYANHHLPFGGVNSSGIGNTHGVYGFQEFSNMRSVLNQHTFSAIQGLFPPYSKAKLKITEFVMKWF